MTSVRSWSIFHPVWDDLLGHIFFMVGWKHQTVSFLLVLKHFHATIQGVVFNISLSACGYCQSHVALLWLLFSQDTASSLQTVLRGRRSQFINRNSVAMARIWGLFGCVKIYIPMILQGPLQMMLNILLHKFSTLTIFVFNVLLHTFTISWGIWEHSDMFIVH